MFSYWGYTAFVCTSRKQSELIFHNNIFNFGSMYRCTTVDRRHTEGIYEDVDSTRYTYVEPQANCSLCKMYRVSKEIELKENEAYGPVSSSHPPPAPASGGSIEYMK